jgi:hypothetical protein
MPNLGLNTITSQLGINYQPNLSEMELFKKINIPKRQKHEYWIFYSPAIKKLPSKGKTLFFASTLAINYSFKVSNKRNLGMGFDLFYDESLKSFYLSEGITYKKGYDFRPGFHLSQDLLFGKFSFLLESGWYLINRTENEKTFYHRLGIKYRLYEHLFILFALKTHWATADYMELALGYNIRW